MVAAAMPERKNSTKTSGAANRRNGTTRKSSLMREVMEMQLSFLFLHMGVLQHWSLLCHCFTNDNQGFSCVLLCVCVYVCMSFCAFSSLWLVDFGSVLFKATVSFATLEDLVGTDDPAGHMWLSV